MNLIQHFLTKNECYIVNQKHEVKGLMLHSTGANNPNLNRYVDIGTKYSANHWNTFQPSGRQVCPHGFIGKLEDGSIASVQTLPYDIVGWHSGKGTKGNANFMGYLGWEICEDDLSNEEYFNKVYREAVEVFAYLCNKYNLNPITDIVCHSEGHKQGIASNHADVMHWFPKFNKNMDTFRLDVSIELDKLNTPTPSPTTLYRVQVGAFSKLENANGLVTDLKAKGYPAFVTKLEKPEVVINLEEITKQITEEVTKQLKDEHEKKLKDFKESLIKYIKESEW